MTLINASSRTFVKSYYAKISDVTVEGFNLIVGTYCDRLIYEMNVSWLALADDCKCHSRQVYNP